MSVLDPIHRRLFPSLARYETRLRRRSILALIGLAVSAWIIGRDMLSAYQGRVATEHMLAVMARVDNLEGQCQREFPQRLTITKAQAQVLTQQREDARRDR